VEYTIAYRSLEVETTVGLAGLSCVISTDTVSGN